MKYTRLFAVNPIFVFIAAAFSGKYTAYKHAGTRIRTPSADWPCRNVFFTREEA